MQGYQCSFKRLNIFLTKKTILNIVLQDDINFQKSIARNMSSNAVITNASTDRQNATELMIVGTTVMKQLIALVNNVFEDNLSLKIA